MTKPKFSVSCIMRNEASHLASFLEPLNEFLHSGGDLCVLDTGSEDGTQQILHDAGARVTQIANDEGFDRYLIPSLYITISPELAQAINDEFIEPPDEPIALAGTKLFDFSTARNLSAGLALNDMLFIIDADEKAVRLDIGAINAMIDQGYEDLACDYVTVPQESHVMMPHRWLDRRKFHFEGVVHELIVGEGKKGQLPPAACSIEHRPTGNANRARYLQAMAYQIYMEPDRSRQTHWLARDLLWSGRRRSALKLFVRHFEMPDCTRGDI